MNQLTVSHKLDLILNNNASVPSNFFLSTTKNINKYLTMNFLSIKLLS